MCFYVTAILPGTADFKKARQIAQSHHLNLELIHNEYNVNQLAPGESQYLTTVGNCDCDTLIGSAGRPESNRHSDRSLAKKERELIAQGGPKRSSIAGEINNNK